MVVAYSASFGETERQEYGLASYSRHRPSRDRKKKCLPFWLDKKMIQIPVDDSVHAHFLSQFGRNKSDRKKTLINITRAAYLQGIKDGASFGDVAA